MFILCLWGTTSNRYGINLLVELVIYFLSKVFVACGLSLSTQVWIVILIPLVTVFCWIRNLDSLAPLATVANICIIFGLSVILYDCFYLIGEQKAAVNTYGVDAFILGGSAIPVFFGNAVYAFEGIGVVRHIRQNQPCGHANHHLCFFIPAKKKL